MRANAISKTEAAAKKASDTAPELDLQRLRLLYGLVQDLSAGRSLDDVLEIAYRRLSGIVPYSRIGLATYTADTDTLTLVAVRSDRPVVLDKGYSGPVKGSSLEPLLRDGEIRIIEDLRTHPGRQKPSSATRMVLEEGARSSLTLPLLIDDAAPVGTLFSSPEPRAYTAQHAEILRGVAGQMARIVDKARLVDTLTTTQDRLQSILHGSADGIFVLNNENHIDTWNAGAERIFGYRADEVLGSSFEQFVPEALRANGELDEIRRRVQDDGYLTDYETTRLTKDGREVTVNITSTLLKDRDGTPIGRSSIVRDVTHVRELQDEVLRTRNLAAIGEMAAQVAHEIRNPLAGISGAVQVLRGKRPPDDPESEIIDEILTQVQRLDQTVKDMLVFARPWTPSKQARDIGIVVRETIKSVAQTPLFEGITVDCPSTTACVVEADPMLLGQVVANLLQNAAHAMGGEGKVTCSWGSEGDRAYIRIADTGCGLPPDIEHRVFDAFFTTRTSGTGLGLPICRKIVDAHGGAIALRNRPEGGVEAEITLPVETH